MATGREQSRAARIFKACSGTHTMPSVKHADAQKFVTALQADNTLTKSNMT